MPRRAGPPPAGPAARTWRRGVARGAPCHRPGARRSLPRPADIEFAIDDLSVTGLVRRRTAVQDPLVRRRGRRSRASVRSRRPGLTRGVLEVAGLPFFPRAIDWTGEPFAVLAELGFNCVRLPTPRRADQLAEARAAGIWVICPPPPIPEIDLTRAGEGADAPQLGSGAGLGSGHGPFRRQHRSTSPRQGRRIRACDPAAGPPADRLGRLRPADRLSARRHARGPAHGARHEPGAGRLARMAAAAAPPGPARHAAALHAGTEIDPAAARQAAALAGVGGRGLAIDPESLTLAAFSAVAGGVRGILFTSSRRLDGDDAEARMRAAAVRETNLRLAVLEPWGAAGRFASRAKTSSPEVQAFVMEAARARVVLAWRCVQGSQIVARRYEGAGRAGRGHARSRSSCPACPRPTGPGRLPPAACGRCGSSG